MAQITIYVEDELLAEVKATARSAGLSQSQWIADAIRLRMRKEWPDSVRALSGAWPDFPTAEQIREQQGGDLTRESL